MAVVDFKPEPVTGLALKLKGCRYLGVHQEYFMGIQFPLKPSLLVVSMMLSFTASATVTPQSTAKVKPLPVIDINQIPHLSQQSQHGVASKRITGIFTRSHYKNFEFNDKLSSKIFDRYFEGLDYNKSIFLASDIQSFEKYRNRFDDGLASGDLSFAYEIFNLGMQRRFERYQYAISLLDKPMDFTTDDSYYYDREEAQWPKDQAQLNELWRQRVKYDALSLNLTGKEWVKIKEVLGKRYKYTLKRITQSQSEDAFQTVMNSFARSVEAHTSYLSPRNADRFKQDMN
ncbi:MAG: carboxyl-terminal processing protease, partial [Alteromonadaceae bacterium]